MRRQNAQMQGEYTIADAMADATSTQLIAPNFDQKGKLPSPKGWHVTLANIEMSNNNFHDAGPQATLQKVEHVWPCDVLDHNS